MRSRSMPIESDEYEFPLTLRVPKKAFVIVAPPPATVTQRTSELHFGIPPRLYREMYRDGLFPAKRLGRLIFAAYEDVKRVVTEGAAARAPVERVVDAAVADPEHDAPMSVESARTYLETARTKKERQDRKKEVQAIATDLMRKYDPTLEDGRPNPNHDKKLSEHAMSLWTICITTRWMAEPGAAPVSFGPQLPCTWCKRPADGIKQAWTGDGWSGAPTCEVCARGRAPNERVIALRDDKILLYARDPTVPRELDPPRRRRRPRA